MQISEFSRKSEITVDTLRYYNKIELIVPSKINSRWIYTEEDLDKASAIRKLKNLNFTLEEIKVLFQFDQDIDETNWLSEESLLKVEGCRSIVEEKYVQILRKEQDLQEVKVTLEKMISKIKKLKETHCFFDKYTSSGEQGDGI